MTDASEGKRPLVPGSPLPVELPSGRRIAIRATEHGEELMVLAPDGGMEVSLELTPNGPVFRLRGARLEIDSTESISLSCRSLALRTEEGLILQAGGDLEVGSDHEIRIKSREQTFIDGDFVNLNCRDRTGYHDEGTDQPTPPALPE